MSAAVTSQPLSNRINRASFLPIAPGKCGPVHPISRWRVSQNWLWQVQGKRATSSGFADAPLVMRDC